MTKKIHNISEVNCLTDEIILRPMNDAELAQYEIDQLAEIERKAQAQAKAIARQAVLDRLGITADEAKLLLG